jgi:hypothetical protein
MRVLYKWEDECFRFEPRTEAYYLEIPKEEINQELLDLLKYDKDGIEFNDRYLEKVSDWARTNSKWGLAKENCAYVLIDKEVTRAILCAVYYPYSGQWNGYCPFMYLYKSELETEEYLKNAIEIEKLDDIKNIDEIIRSKGFIPRQANN